MDERKSYILREIVDIKDLLEDYDDIKWIYEALVEYTTALWQLTGQVREQQEQRDVGAWLARLRELDPMRNGRWNDLETQLDLTEIPTE